MYIPEALWHLKLKSCHHRKWSADVVVVVAVDGEGPVVVGYHSLLLPSFIQNKRKNSEPWISPKKLCANYIYIYRQISELTK